MKHGNNKFVLYPVVTQLLIMKEIVHAHPAITCSKLTKEILEQGVKYVQS